MSEYMEKHAVSKLIGSPPGYVGHEEGVSYRARAAHPYAVVLLERSRRRTRHRKSCCRSSKTACSPTRSAIRSTSATPDHHDLEPRHALPVDQGHMGFREKTADGEQKSAEQLIGRS